MGTKDIKTHSLTTTSSQAKQERYSLNKKGPTYGMRVRSRGRRAHLDGGKDRHN